MAYGYYDAAAQPVMRIASGDVVRIHTLITSTPARLEGAGVARDQVEPALREVVEKVTNKGPGGHILTGPIFVEGAEPGDVLEVRIRKIDLAIPYAYNAFSTRGGFLPQDFTAGAMKIIPLDAKRMVGHFADGIEIPLHPFFGSMGVAPPPAAGRVSSAPPGRHAGNIDNKELVAGTTLYIPVHVAGALFEVGDGHAAQGDGEVDITALETSLVGTFQFIVRKDLHLTWPRAETPTALDHDGHRRRPDRGGEDRDARDDRLPGDDTEDDARGRLHADQRRRRPGRSRRWWTAEGRARDDAEEAVFVTAAPAHTAPDLS